MKIKNNILLFILSILFGIKSFAQVYPVQINTQLIPPYSLKLSDYITPGTNRVGVNVLLTDVTKPEYHVRLELVIEGNGITIKTSPNYNPGPVILQGGVPEYFTSSDLAEYFNPRNLEFSGYSKSDYNATGRLPEGVYRFSFRAYDYNKRVRVSNSTAITAWLLLNDPPIINIPLPDYKVEHIDPQNIVFQWTPRHTGSPNSAFTTEYEFSLVEIWPDGRDPNNAMQTTMPIYQTTTTRTSLVYGLSEPFLEPGRKYAYRVQARDMDGRDMFKNNGYSEVRTFTFGDACKLVTQVKAKAEKAFEAEISWQPDFNQTAFNVRYRKAGDPDAEWFEEDTYLDYIKITGLQENTKYEYQVMAYCGTYEGDYTDIKTFTTPVLEVSSFECGATDDDKSISNHEPLPVLNKGDYIWSGNFMFKITEATGSNGTFSGKAYGMIPYFNYLKLVAEFTNIKVNTDNQVYEGEITSVYNPDSPFVFDFSDDDEDGDGDNDETTGGGDTTDDDTTISDTTFTVDIDSVYIDGDDIIIVTEDGTDTLNTDEDIIIIDEDGDTWTVEDGVVTTGGGGGGGPDGGGPTGGGPDDTTEQDTIATDASGVLVKFDEYTGQNNGFDPYDEQLKAMFSPPYEIHGEEYFAAWKSLKEGSFDHVKAVLELSDTTFKAEDIKYKTATGTNLSAEPISNSDDKSVYLFGQIDETEDEIIAYVTATDTVGNEQEIEVGKLRVISYREEAYQMKLVPVNMEMNEVNLTGLAQKINDIYSQSVVNWNITLDNRFNISVEDWDKDDNGVVDDSESSAFSNYTKEMNKIIRKYKQERDADKNTYYVLLLGDLNPESGNLAGYMPFKQQFGMLFIPVTGKDENMLAQIVSHEIGHGAFRLFHTFSSRSEYIRNEGTTNNLMDYNNGTHLNKYQWDFIHDPESGLYLFQDEEEAAAFAVTDTIKLQLSNVPGLFAPGNKDLEFSYKLDNIKELQEKYPDEEFESVIQIINNENQIVFSKQNELLEEGIIKWDGSVTKENNEKEFIKSENGPYKIILSVFAGPQSTLEQLELVLSDWEAFKAAFDEDETVSIKNSTEAEFNIDINWEDWNTYEDMQVYASNNYDQYELMCDKYKNAFDVFKDKSPMEYFIENLEEITFFGNTIKVHKDFASILTQVESNLSGTNVGSISIWQPFQMRTIYGGSSTISQHGLGLALDINVKFNPFLSSDRTSVRYLIKRSTNLDCANIKNYSIEQIVEASNLFKQTFENSGFEIIKAALDEISLYESDNNNISINSLKDNVIYNSLSEFTNIYNQVLIDTLIGDEERANRLNELKNNIDSYTDQLGLLKDIISYHEKIVIYSDAGLNSIAYIEGYIDDVVEIMEDLAENIEKLENNQTPTNNIEISQMQINTTNLSPFTNEKNGFYSNISGSVSEFLTNLNSELNDFIDDFENNPFVDGFCNLHPELIKAFENFSKIRWGGDYNDFMHIEINPSYNNDIIK